MVEKIKGDSWVLLQMIWGFNYTEDLFKCLRTSSLNPLNYTESKVYISEAAVDRSWVTFSLFLQPQFLARMEKSYRLQIAILKAHDWSKAIQSLFIKAFFNKAKSNTAIEPYFYWILKRNIEHWSLYVYICLHNIYVSDWTELFRRRFRLSGL